LDLVVLQTDYEKLISVLKEELPENFKVQARGTDKKHWFYYARVRDTHSRIYGKKPDSYDYQGIFIDVFFIEPVPSMYLKETIDKFLISEIRVVRATSLWHKIKYRIMFSFIPIIRLIIKLIRMYYKYLGNTKLYTYSFGTFFYPTYNIEHFYPVNEIMFEGRKYKAPHDVDKYLTDNFDSNFMVIPKPERRSVHNLKIDFL
jgi:phosphorylcholine metabolism protein LicD